MCTKLTVLRYGILFCTWDYFILHHTLKYYGNPAKTHPRSNTAIIQAEIVS